MTGPPRSDHPEDQGERQEAQPEDEKPEMDHLDRAHVASGSGHRRAGRGIGEVRFGTVLVVVPAVVESHPASVAQAPRLANASPVRASAHHAIRMVARS